MSDTGGLTDDVDADVNPTGGDTPAGELPSVPARPSDGAPKAAWIDYAVALGADREALTGEREHWDEQGGDSENGGYVPGRALTRNEIRDVADSLGG